MSTKLLVIYYLYTIITLLHSGWPQTNQYSSYSLLHSTPNNLCSTPGTHYCTYSSLHGPEILSCVSRTRAELRSCNIELARIIPKAMRGYESSPDAGDAICAFNGMGYSRLRGGTVEVPGTEICEDETDETDSSDGVDFISFGERALFGWRLGIFLASD
ncbi:hypothetical protein BDV38DRAFT_287255 [Aspergillus pseudotamarii]|uniref:Uncharacterized protein n=1 Tax=Aspergillus pseudotamarii TaxID=132259 RepID=A0A5N6SGN9_ASPPS|nr:uncharacterized protein BDV38DRAFT_287255 [Aspergillus pseudotamarii]KAE8132900.1 hypothetical protein BDV38DRAFT_287255 [Aspergillus pseudotamarii]